MSFNGKVILITGASSGIGADAARHLGELGAKVSIIGRNEQRLNSVAEEIEKSGAQKPSVIVADVTKDAERIVNETIKYFGQLDVLINNAGFAFKDTAANANLSEFDRLFDTNVRSVVNLTKLCVPHLEKTNGNIVNVSSVAGIMVLRDTMSYSMSKAALDQFTKCQALDLASKMIRINSINPGHIRTNIFESRGQAVEQYEEALKTVSSKYPVGRVGEVSDTSEAIAYLADNKVASFITGILLPVDGGILNSGFYK